jgi:hypothetical protein
MQYQELPPSDLKSGIIGDKKKRFDGKLKTDVLRVPQAKSAGY